MDELRTLFLEECIENIDALETGSLSMRGGDFDRDTLDLVFRAAHSTVYATSPIAAVAAACAAPLTLNGPRMRWRTSRTWAGAYIQPTRSAARP